jgi:prophage regulatory protein
MPATPPVARATSDTLPPLEPSPARLVFKGELLERTGLSFPTIWSMMRKGKFPRSRVVGGKSAWLANEVDAWFAALPRRRLKGDDDVR